MADSNYYDCFAFLVKDYAPIADAKASTWLTFQFLDIAVAGRRESIKFLANTISCLGRQFEPLACRRRAE
jgi:hypothetical protein